MSLEFVLHSSKRYIQIPVQLLQMHFSTPFASISWFFLRSCLLYFHRKVWWGLRLIFLAYLFLLPPLYRVYYKKPFSMCSHRCHSIDLVFGVKFVDCEDQPSVFWDMTLPSMIQTCRDLSHKHNVPIFSWSAQKAVIIPLIPYICGW